MHSTYPRKARVTSIFLLRERSADAAERTPGARCLDREMAPVKQRVYHVRDRIAIGKKDPPFQADPAAYLERITSTRSVVGSMPSSL